jgi:hypothetical protein
VAKPVREIPSVVTKIDMITGKETIKPVSWKIMPPSKDCCQICGRKHASYEPHDALSIYYQMAFEGINGRGPTWADAVAHCIADVRLAWKKALGTNWTEPSEGEMPVKHHGVD